MKSYRFLCPAVLLGTVLVGSVARAVEIDCFLEYLGSTGTQYIDTGYVFKTKPRVETRAMLMTASDLDVAGTAAGNVAGCFLLNYKGDTFYYRYGNTSSKSGTSSVTLKDNWVDYVWDNSLYHNGVLMTTQTSYGFSANSASFWLFASGRNKSSIRFQEVKMYDGGVLVRDLVPAKSGGVAGMYDRQNDVFYANAGSGTFEEGASYLALAEVSGNPAEFGTVSPSYGSVHITESTTSFSLSGAVTFGDGVTAYPSASGLERALFEKATIAPDVGATSVFTTTSFAWTRPAGAKSVAAEWSFTNRQVCLSLARTGGPSANFLLDGRPVPFGDFWLDEGTNVTVSVVTDATHSFDKWTGDGAPCLTDCDRRRETVTLRLVKGLSLTATFGTPVYVSKTGSDSDAGDFDHPVRTFSRAFELVTAGGEIRVGDGSYTMDSTLTVPTDVRIVGTNGAESVEFVPNGSVAPTVCAANSGGYLSGIAISGLKAYPLLKIAASNVIDRCVVRGGNSRAGTPVMIDGGTFVDSVVSNNVTGLYNYSSGRRIGAISMSDGLVDRCIIVNNCRYGNASDVGGVGGVQMSGGALRNSLIAGNEGGGVTYASGVVITDGRMENCTVVDNGASGIKASDCVGLYQNGGTVVNSIVWGNFNYYGINNALIKSGTTECTCSSPLLSGSGNISSNPMFEDAANGDYRLGYSAAVDAGTELSWHGTAKDMANKDRILGAAVDLGCYEYVPESFACSFTQSVERGFAPLKVTVSANVRGSTQGILYRWIFDDGVNRPLTNETALSTVSFDFDAGLYDIRLEVENKAGEKALAEIPSAVYAAPSVVHADVTNVGKSKFPYASAATAATNLLDAIGACVSGAELRAESGTYTLASSLDIPENVRVVSAAGPSETRIAVASAFSPIVSAEFEGAVFSGFAIDGSTALPLLKLGADAVATNCVVRGGNSRAAPAVYNDGGTLVDCTVSNNVTGISNYSGSKTGAIYMTGGLVDRCRIVDNHCMSGYDKGAAGGVQMAGGTLRNSLIADNAGNGGGYGSGVTLTKGRVENCTIANNGDEAVKFTDCVGLYQTGGEVVNSIVWGNFNYYGENNFYTNSSAVATCTDSSPILSGTGNLNANPMFEDAANGDYRLGYSAAVDAGTELSWHGGAKDLEGKNRVIGSAVDLGCYEYELKGLACSFTMSAAEGKAPLKVTLTATVVGDTKGVVYRWILDDGHYRITNEVSTATIDFHLEAGLYDVRLEVENDAGEAGFSEQADAILSAPPVAYVDSVNGSSENFPYAAENSAAPTIAEALAYCTGGCEVRLAAGEHALSAGVLLSGGQRLVGTWGPERTVVCGAEGCSADMLIELKDAGTVLSGVSVSGGSHRMVKANAGTVVTNCVLRNFLVGNGDSGDAPVIVEGGTLADCIVTNNSCNFYRCCGGGVKMTSGLVDRCLIANNSPGRTYVSHGGGGVYMEDGTLRNSLVVSNWCDGAGLGVFMKGGLVESCTIAGNVRGNNKNDGAAGLYMSGGTLRNSIVWANANYYGLNNITNTGAGVVEYTDADPAPAGTSNMNVNPMFADASGGDYRLGYSAVVDAGVSAAWHEGAADLEGKLRVIGSAIDLGCYEYLPKGLEVAISLSATEGLAPLSVTATATAVGDTAGIGYRWTFSNEVTKVVRETTEDSVSVALSAGRYDVLLEATNAVGKKATSSIANAVYAAPSVIYADASNSGGCRFPYATEETAATNVADAVDAAISGCEVRVGAGAYPILSTLDVKANVRLVSTGGPAVTRIVAASGSFSPVVSIEFSGCAIEGFAVDGSRALPLVSVGEGATARNCVFRGGRSSGYGEAAYVNGGTLVDSVVSNNVTGVLNYSGNRIGGVHMTAGLVDRCLIADNRPSDSRSDYGRGIGGVNMTGGTLRNSLVVGNVGNEASDSASGVYLNGGTVLNCTIADNGSNGIERVEHAGVLMLKGSIANSVIWNNFNSSGVNNLSRTAGLVTYTCAAPIVDGTGNVASDPRFRGTGATPYRPVLSSPCTETGDNSTYGSGLSSDTDISGRRRKIRSRIDMGCYEVPLSGLSLIVR